MQESGGLDSCFGSGHKLVRRHSRHDGGLRIAADVDLVVLRVRSAGQRSSNSGRKVFLSNLLYDNSNGSLVDFIKVTLVYATRPVDRTTFELKVTDLRSEL